MEPVILNSISFQPDPIELLEQLRIREGSPYRQDFQILLDEAKSCARPKSLYRLAFIEAKSEDHVRIEGHRFPSRVLRVNLDTAQRVFAYLATCGMELEDWSKTIEDFLFQFWADAMSGSPRAV